MKYLILFILLAFYQNSAFTQSYSVSSYQKINEINGNFNGTLDNEDNLGVSIDEIGDLDGNGVNDLAVGAFSDDDGGFNRGAVWILFLDINDNVISSTKISDTSGNFSGTLDNDDRFGGAVSYLGDLNNDGFIELAVGADYDEDGGIWHGAVWILSLNIDGTVNSHSKISDTQGGFTGVINGDAIFGTDITNIGDLNNDGIEDLAVGSRRDNDGGGNSGALWILFMNSDFTVNSSQKISSTSGGMGVNFGFEDYFGGSVANLGDLNGDGVVDLAVGSYRDDDQDINSGSIYILFLNVDGTVNTYQKISNLSGGLTANISQEALFGESIDGVVDFDGDGKIEIIVGAMKQNNPTLSSQTGGFFILELNTNGTVSEEYFYTFGENCFTGQLQNGDLFGGSVSFLNDDTDNLKIAVGAYRDSENGNRKGAAWILNLSEVNIGVSTVDPTVCGGLDGSVTLSGLMSNQSYTVVFDYEGQSEVYILDSNSDGDVILTNLNSGLYENISISESISGACSYEIDNVTLNSDNWSMAFSVVSHTSCGNDEGSILLSNLAPNTIYSFQYNYGMLVITGGFVSNGDGEYLFSDLSAGIYEFFTVLDATSTCTGGVDSIQILGETFNSTIASTNPTNCTNSDGEIIISDLSNNLDYIIEYTLDGVVTSTTVSSDNNGTILLSGLSSGNYESINIQEVLTGCTDILGSVILSGPSLSATIVSTNPTNCTNSDGELIISDLSNNLDYIIEYTLDGVVTSTSVSSDNNGTILLFGLSSGNYESINIEEVLTGCTDILGSVTLSSPSLSAFIASINPTSCTDSDGELIISDLSNNLDYIIEYTLEGVTTSVTITSDNTGVIQLTALSSGNYENIIITDVLTDCFLNLGIVLLGCEIENPKCFDAKPFFTPNNDDVNDTWFLIPSNQNEICRYKLHIFNRYGKLIRVLTNNDNHWDGTYDGNKMPSSDYWYVVYYSENGNELTYKSHFALKR